MSRIAYNENSNLEQNIHKVVYKDWRTIVPATISDPVTGKYFLPSDKSGVVCYSAGYYERQTVSNWEDLEWLPDTIADEVGLPILKDAIQAYKDNQTKRQFFKKAQKE